MALWSRWSWLLVVLLYGTSSTDALARHWRQSDTRWRRSETGWGSSRALGQPVSEVGSSRGSLWSPAESVPGFGPLRGVQPVSGWGSSYPVGGDQPQEPPASPISVQCGEDRMVVTVWRDLYGTGKLLKPSDLTLGFCGFAPQTTDTMVVFDNGLQECGSSLEMTPDWLIYSFNLRYTPATSSTVPVIRANPAVVPIQCFYPRHANVSSNAIKPTWIPFGTTVTTEEQLTFSLHIMTDDWSAPRPSLVFQLGDIFYLEASLDTRNHVPMILFVDGCVATTTPNVTSNPRYEIISNNGCLMDGMQEDSSSVFVSPRPQVDKLRFMVDAFKFIDGDLSTIYITCSLRAAAINKTPDPMNKACSYNKSSSSWSPVEGPSGICQCCSTMNCTTAAGQTMTWDSFPGSPRGLGKRDVGSHLEEHGLVTQGPLLVISTKPMQDSRAGIAQASRRRAGHEPLRLWMLVAIGLVTSVVVVVAVALVMAGKRLLKRLSCLSA